MSWYSALRNKIAHLAARGGFDRSLDEELRIHLEMRAEELAQTGQSPEAAAAQARREFGPAARAAEESRAAWRWNRLEDLARDLRYAARALGRDRGFALAAIVSLALGIGVNTTVFSLTAEFLFSEPSVRDARTLVAARIGGGSHAPVREYRFLRDAGVFDGLAGLNEETEVNWRFGDASVRLFGTRVTDNFFTVTGAPVAAGRGFRSGERDVAVATHRFWQSRLNADPVALGRVLMLDGRPHTVVGILPERHRTLTGFGFSPDLYLPVNHDDTLLALYARLPEGMGRRAALEKLRAACVALDQIFPDGNHKWASGISVTSVTGLERLTEDFVLPVSAFFAMLMVAVGLLLLIACVNVAGLLLARGTAREHEFAVRSSIGASRGRLVQQLLAESLMLSIAGAAAGLGLNYLLTRVLNQIGLPIPVPIRLAIEPDWRLLIYASAVAVLSALAAGLLPALKTTRSGPSAMLKRDERQVAAGRGTLRSALVVGQLALSVVVLITAGLFLRNLLRAAALHPGFDIQSTVWAQMRPVPESFPDAERKRALAGRALERLAALPGVESAAAVSVVPLNDNVSRNEGIVTDLSQEEVRTGYAWNAVGPGYFRTMSIPILAGREFAPEDRDGSARAVIVNEAFARRVFGKVHPVGRALRIGGDPMTVVGVAGNSKYFTMGEDNRPAIYESYFQRGGGRASLHFVLRASGPPAGLVKAVSTALLEVDTASAVEVKPMSRAMAFALLPSRAGAALLGAIGALGLALAAIGFYGMLAYTVSRRFREIGLRAALGAQRHDLLRLALTQGAAILLAGLTIGMFAAAFLTRPLAMFLAPGLRPSDPLTYFAVAIVLIAAGCLASVRPALRAMRIDPFTALRHE